MVAVKFRPKSCPRCHGDQYQELGGWRCLQCGRPSTQPGEEPADLGLPQAGSIALVEADPHATGRHFHAYPGSN